MRVTHTTTRLDITDGPGAVKLLDAFIEYVNPSKNIAEFDVRRGRDKLTFTGTDGFGESHKVTLELAGPLKRISDWSDDLKKELIGYQFDARVDGEAVEVEYWLKDPGYGRGFIKDAVEETV